MNNSNEGNWRSISQATTAGIYLVDEQYRVLLFNDAAPGLYKKVTGGELHVGLDFVSLVIDGRKDVVRKAIDAAFKGLITEYEVQYTAPLKGWISVRYSQALGVGGSCTGVGIALQDITAKKELEEEARQREQKFRGLFDFSSIGMALVSTNGKLLDVNPALVKLWGYTKNELLRLSFQEITHPADLGQDLQYLQQLLAGEIGLYRMEKRYFHKSGAIMWGLLSVSLVRQADGSPDFLIGQVVDITPAKAMIKELEEKNHALDFAAHDLEQKIQQMEEFTHVVGHNLRGPAANISSMANLLKESSPEELPAWIDKLQHAASSLLLTLTELLTYSQVKLTKGITYEDCDLRAMCNELLTQVAGTDIGDDIAISYQLGFAVVSYPKVYLESILYNLLSNAVKYRKPETPLHIAVKTGIDHDRRWLSIADNGTGFDLEKNKDKIFKLNSTFHKGYNSKGIGLFLTKAQVEKLGGSIAAESKPGEGATFTIIL